MPLLPNSTFRTIKNSFLWRKTEIHSLGYSYLLE